MQWIYFAGKFVVNLNIHMPQDISYGKVIVWQSEFTQ
jgi:hypothetical protein